KDRLGDILIRMKKITTPQLLEMLVEQKETGRRLGEILIDGSEERRGGEGGRVVSRYQGPPGRHPDPDEEDHDAAAPRDARGAEGDRPASGRDPDRRIGRASGRGGGTCRLPISGTAWATS